MLNVDLKPLGPLLAAHGGGQAGLNAFGADCVKRCNSGARYYIIKTMSYIITITGVTLVGAK